MATETKLGLLIGITFIVCFGVVLSHRDQEHRLGEQLALDLLQRHFETEKEAPTPSLDSYLRDRERRQATAKREPVDVASVLIKPRRNAATNRNRSAKSNGIAYQFPRRGNSATGDDVAGQSDPRKQSGLNDSRKTVAEQETRSKNHGSQKQIPNVIEASQDPAKKKVKPRVRDREEFNLPGTKPRDTTYVVRSGDTLWGIAGRTYDSASRSAVERIYAANRSTMRSPDDLRPGMRIILPHAPTGRTGAKTGRAGAKAGRAGADTGKAANRTHAEAMPKRSKGVKYYNVREGDRYTSIAARYLGDKSRWKELYALNKDIFPNASLIRPGVRIRLPAGANMSQ